MVSLAKGDDMMKKKLILTINREYGSGGKQIGQKLSEILDIPYYDDDIIKISSEHAAVAEEYFRVNDERPGNHILHRIVGGLMDAMDRPSLEIS